MTNSYLRFYIPKTLPFQLTNSNKSFRKNNPI